MDSFNQRKKDILSKVDKSSIGKWDYHIVQLCQKINLKEGIYTTSSCSGRIVVMKDFEKKGPGLFEFVTHEKISYEKFSLEFENLEGNLKFKQEPPILHVACKNLEVANEFLEKGLRAGFKRSGIIFVGKHIIVELNGTDKIEFPIAGKLNEEFLRKVIEKSNSNLERGWSKIKALENEI